MKLHYITNNDPGIQEKMRYFADYFSYVNEFLGKLQELPFDNQLSLIDKAIFQIDNNAAYCSAYVISYLDQLFYHFAIKNQPDDPAFSRLKMLLKNFKEADNRKDWIKYNPEFMTLLKEIKATLNTNLFELNFKALQSCLTCKHPLKKHKSTIQYSCRIIVSMFRLKGHSKEALDTYMGRIVSRDKYDFPFPPDIAVIQRPDHREPLVESFLKNSSFNKQVDALKSLYITDQHKYGYFLFVIENCILNDNIKKTFKVDFNEVTFISPLHADLNILKKSIKEEDQKHGERTFRIFFGKDKLLAYIKMGYENSDYKKNDALKTVNRELLGLSQYTGQNLSVNATHYLVTESIQSNLWRAKTGLQKIKKTRLSEFDMEQFKHNPFEVLREVNSPAKQLVLQNENVFLKAFARDEVEFYWIYIENIFAPLDKPNEKIQKAFSRILFKLIADLKNDYMQQIGFAMGPFSMNFKEENLTLDDFTTIHAELFAKHNMNFNIYQFKDKVASGVLKDMILYHKEFMAPEKASRWKQYFSSLLLDLYGYRNSFVHTGKVNEYTGIKLAHILPKLVSRARWLIINSCKENPELTYIELMEKLIK